MGEVVVVRGMPSPLPRRKHTSAFTPHLSLVVAKMVDRLDKRKQVMEDLDNQLEELEEFSEDVRR